MKRSVWPLPIVALVLLAIPLSAQVPQGITTIEFDQHCDGMTLNVTGVVIRGTHNLYDCVNNTAVGGNVSVDVIQPQILPKQNAYVSSLAGGSCIFNYYLDFGSKAWAVYHACDAQAEELADQGTFTIATGTLKRERGTLSTARPIPPLSTENGADETQFDIRFDFQCDGMHITQKGMFLGGRPTGCNATLGILGGNIAQEQAGIVPINSIIGSGANIASTINHSGCVVNYYLYWRQQVWSAYGYCFNGSIGGNLGLINQGTFSYGTPAAR